MFYVHRNEQNEVVGLTRWPNGSTERLPKDHPEVAAMQNPPPPPDVQVGLETAIEALRPLATSITDPEASDFAVSLLDVLTGKAGNSGKVAGKPV